MPTAKNQHTIFAGTQGVFGPDPDKYGRLTVEPIFPGSCQAKRQGYRWVCTDVELNILYIPFRDFVVLEDSNPKKPLTTQDCDVN